MTSADSVSGVHVVDQATPELETAIGTLWIAVVRAGGAVGFRYDAPDADVRAAAGQAIEEVRSRRQRLLVLGPDHAVAGAVFLRHGTGSVVSHRADVLRLMVRPDLQGQGWGRALLDAAVAHATALGLEQLLLSTRGGTDLPAFYRAMGWAEVGVWPGALRVGPDDLRDEHWFQLRLR